MSWDDIDDTLRHRPTTGMELMMRVPVSATRLENMARLLEEYHRRHIVDLLREVIEDDARRRHIRALLGSSRSYFRVYGP